MSFEIVPLRPFAKQLKRLVRKFPSLEKEFVELVDALGENPRKGTSIGNGCYKIRLTIASKGGGKSGGSRVITHVRVTSERIYLLSIYDKSEKGTLGRGDLAGMSRSDHHLTKRIEPVLRRGISSIPSSPMTLRNHFLLIALLTATCTMAQEDAHDTRLVPDIGSDVIIDVAGSQEPDSNEVLMMVEEMPEFPGGMAALSAYVIPPRNRTSSSLLALFPHVFSERMAP